MDKTTIILPISRDEYLKEFLTSIELLDCDQTKVNVLAIVDGNVDLYLKVRNLLTNSKYAETLTIHYKASEPKSNYDILARRLRIADIHNTAKQHVFNTEYVMIIEDDTFVPYNAFKRLYEHYIYKDRFAGFVQGIEAGRWGIKYLGAWTVDNIYEPTEIISLELQDGVKQVDAGGFYCFMTKSEYYVNHDFKPFDNNGLGPDVDFGIEMRRQGLKNYTDFMVKCRHKSSDGQDITVDDAEVIRIKKNETRWRQQRV